jgi:hypothetical protein
VKITLIGSMRAMTASRWRRRHDDVSGVHQRKPTRPVMGALILRRPG